MKAKCIEVGYNLKMGQEYIVYAMAIYDGSVWYAIREYEEYCTAYFRPSSLFAVIDNRISRYWVFAQDKVNDKVYSRWAFPEWAEDLFYVSNLVEGSKRENTLLSEYMELMDLEFPDPEISEIAQIGDDEWLICPTCMDAWVSPSGGDALVICPKCQRKMKNPRYSWGKEPKGGKVTTLLPTKE